MHKHTNRLASQTSPYLLQHAHNPVNWYPWGTEALALAKQEDRPILVSIGYSACHWCHVMERESFENEDTASIMNENFVNIKIDREERPDIDQIYMDAVQAMTGSGGWPLNVFLLPDGRPFFGGTYFPPERAYNRSSWKETLLAVTQAYKEKRSEIEMQAENLTQHIASANIFGVQNQTEAAFERQFEDQIAQNMLKQGDTTWGGFGRAPKFPQSFTIVYLLRYYAISKDEAALQQALLSLDKMCLGGIYDHLGGGFARYSTDEQWLAPHFEKMLYDNALLVSALSEAYTLTKKDLYKQTINQSLAFVQRELWLEEGGFFSALDADSEGVEGKFYTWSKAEIEEVLKDEGDLFCRYYNVSDTGNWEHTNILWITRPLTEVLDEMGLDHKTQSALAGYHALLEKQKQQLFEIRKSRVRPGTDDKVLLGWNALMNVAFCKAFMALSTREYRDVAIKNMEFLERRFYDQKTGQWYHTYKNEEAKYPAFVDDYAYLVQAYLHLQEATGNPEYLQKARKITEYVLANFRADDPYFFYTHKEQTDVIVRKKEVYDGATPSGNSTMAANLLYLSRILDISEWYDMAVQMVEGVQQAVVKYPTSFANWATVLMQLTEPVHEIAVIGEKAEEIAAELFQHFIPLKIIQYSNAPDNNYPLLAGKSVEKENLIYWCRDYVCQTPVKTVSALLKQMQGGEEK